jgi:hypothetical protein
MLALETGELFEFEMSWKRTSISNISDQTEALVISTGVGLGCFLNFS